MSEIKERPILFNTAMVCAVLNGHKTQTRRIFKPFGTSKFKEAMRLLCLKIGVLKAWTPYVDKCPYGKVGDRLWVRETFRYSLRGSSCMKGYVTGIEYRSDGIFKQIDFNELKINNFDAFKWRPSIHMPRWASRINLEMTDIRVERVKDITETDAQAEGVSQYPSGLTVLREFIPYVSEFKRLWDSLHEKHNRWITNPWVWVIEFKRIPRA